MATDRIAHDRFWDLHRAQLEFIPHILPLLAAGEPVPLERIAAAAASPVEDVETALRRHQSTEWDEQGRLVGFGLTLRPTPHRFTFDGRTVYGWCATDTLIFPMALGRPGVSESTCPATGRPIRIELTPEGVASVNPPGAVVSVVRPEKFDDIRAETCALGSFFASRDAAAGWLAAHPDGMVHSVEEDFQLNRTTFEQFGWTNLGVGGLDAIIGSVVSQRVAAVPGPARDTHRTILRAFAATGTAPASAVLDREHLAVLAGNDIIGLDAGGEIAYAYPFSTRATPHRVLLAGGAHPYAMCAIDALGTPAMLDTDAVITSRDPRTGEPIFVTVTGGRTTWRPASAVVLVAGRVDCCATTSAESCCGTINFFATRGSATAWAAEHAEVRGDVLDQDAAFRTGIRYFGTLLS